MKLPVIRHLHKNHSVENLEATLEVLEAFTDHRSCTDEDMDVIGEFITNICGAMEVHKMVEEGMNEREAATSFAKRVMGSIDQ